jgi:hypothetical protein
MKKLALILILIPTILKSQSPREVKVIQLLNEYRVANNLTALTIDTGLNKAAEYQVKYEVLIDSVTHYQYTDLPGFKEIPQAEDRIKEFSDLEAPMGGTEITMGTKNFGSLSLVKQKYSYREVEKYIIDSYKSSPSHDEIILNPNAHKVGISIFREEIIEGSDVKIRLFCVITFGS